MVKLSIIIPYYKTYELTNKLLKELSIQATDEVEILVYDDGCNETRLDAYDGLNKICIKHQANMGVAKTRNRGVYEAKGEYIAFIDSDDQITINYIDTLLNAIELYKTDIINFNWLDLNDNVVIRKPDNPAVWKAIYKKEIIVKFREDMEYGSEDFIFQCELNNKIKNKEITITYLDKVLYLYNSNREGSLMWLKMKEKI